MNNFFLLKKLRFGYSNWLLTFRFQNIVNFSFFLSHLYVRFCVNKQSPFFLQAMTLGLLEMYHKIKDKLRPTPTQAHYVFNLHDVARVVHGILLMSPRSRTRKMMRRKKGDNESSNFHLGKKKY